MTTYGITFTTGEGDGGFTSEAEAIRTALEFNDPKAVIWYGYERLGRAIDLADEIGLDEIVA